MHAFICATIFTGEVLRRGAAVLVEKGIVIAVTKVADIPERAMRCDLGDALLAPGFIDIQVNGGGGALFNDMPSVENLSRIAAAHRRFGTTGFLPTLISCSRSKRRAAREAVATALNGVVPGVLGLHLEGPHLNPARRGVHDIRWLAAPDLEDETLMAPLADGCLLVTLAPEIMSLELIERLARAGVFIAAGHTAADYDRTRAALAAGMTGFTHLFNAMAPFSHREPGVIGAALDDAESWCGIIADGHHLHDAAIRLAWRAKRAGKLVLVTDAMPPVGAGSDFGAFRLGDEVVTVVDGRCITAEGRLAGSALDMATAVRNCVERIGIPLEEALRMAGAYPAAALGLSHRYGRIAAGYAADFVVLDERLTVRQTFIAGRASTACHSEETPCIST
ncbi:MAG: N-acetylglucosamine-6-phosphate deacetylase [Rhodospirillaceae bacterium]